MGITFDKLTLHNTAGKYRPTLAMQTKIAGTGATVTRTNRSFDEIMISTQNESGEKEFSRMLVSKLSVEVRKTAEPERLKELEERIASGEYKIDTDNIAGMILLDGKGK